MRPAKSYREDLIESLKEPKEALHYLNAALEDDDPRVFLLALKDVIEALGGMSRVARSAKLNRENMYRMLSRRGNPAFLGIEGLLSAMGFRLAVRREKEDLSAIRLT